tara:strand:- start:3363 stop:3515 length:153 start_codon:yes stop_codon:yes gene_type:complete
LPKSKAEDDTVRAAQIIDAAAFQNLNGDGGIIANNIGDVNNNGLDDMFIS